MKDRRLFFLLILIVFHAFRCYATDGYKTDESTSYISYTIDKNAFPVVTCQFATPMYFDKNDYSGVKKVIKLFQNDIFMVTGQRPDLIDIDKQNSKYLIIIGTLGKNALIDKLILDGKIDVSDLKDKWEANIKLVVDKPFNGVEKALVIIGSDKRGTIFGMFDISRKIGVSPWYWWADVPVMNHEEIFIKEGRYFSEEPKVKYRGIFINDEEPALGRWVVGNYGGFNHEFYEKVYELILRLKGNYLWPAMWWSGFFTDDTSNHVKANEMGIVIGTSHHEPMMRAHAEWKKEGVGDWNYETNDVELKEFWSYGIKRMRNNESIVTMAMRGDGDKAMDEKSNIELLEKIVSDQRLIIEEITGKKAENTPQLWALYKEVQEYYDKGMTVPEDITLLFCDDNWGNVRHLPALNAPARKGGYGMYYHFDYVGGPRSYKWLNVTHLSRVWEQMNLCYNYGVDKIWLVNVGDIKPMELPITFFMDFAWNPEFLTFSDLKNYHKKWAEEQFGKKYAKQIAEILWLYTKYNRRCTPEMLNSQTYSINNYNEFERVTNDYNDLLKISENIYDEIEEEYKNAYFQLVHHPVWACSNLYQMYFAQAKNFYYYKQNRAATNIMAEEVKKYFDMDKYITRYYHKKLSDGKWDCMMAQPHIGYTDWKQPTENILPNTKKNKIPNEPSMKVTYYGYNQYWVSGQSDAIFPEFDSYNDQTVTIEVFNTGKKSFTYEINCNEKWITFSKKQGIINLQDTINIKIAWNKLDEGRHTGKITIKSNISQTVNVTVNAIKYAENENIPESYIERNGYISIEAGHFSEKNNKNGASWGIIPGLSRTESGITTFPVTKSFSVNDKEFPELTYNFHLLREPENESVTVFLYVAPTHNFTGKGLYYAIAVDDEDPQVINIHENDTVPDWNYPNWFNNAVGNYCIKLPSKHKLKGNGNHKLRLYSISNGVIFQKIVIDNGGLKGSNLGPPESIKK